MEKFTVEYEPRLVEEAVLRALGGAEREEAFRAERNRLYEIADPEVREAKFRALHAAWFEQLGLDGPIGQALHERPAVAARTSRCLVVRASSSRDEGAELFVLPEDGAGTGRCTVLIRLRPETVVRADALRWLLRHELTHIHDMLDPRFGYAPWIPRTEGGPAQGQLVRERYGVLWDAYIDGRLARCGWAPPGIRAERLGQFARAFPMLDARTEEAFDGFFGAASCSHAELMAFATDPESVLGVSPRSGRPGGRCPLCRFPTHVFEPEPDRLPPAVQQSIRHDFSEWDAAIGLCLQCADLYRARSVSAGPESLIEH